MNIYKVIITIIFLCLFGNNVIASSSGQVDIDTWHAICRDFKSNIFSPKKEGNSYVTFSELSTAEGGAKYWVLGLQGLLIPLPAVNYSIVAIKTRDERGTSIYLTSESKHITVVFEFDQFPDWSIDTLLGASLENLDPNSLTLKELSDYGFTITPQDLSCEGDIRISQLKIFSALALKELNSIGTLVSAHRIQGEDMGWLTQSKWGRRVVWKAKKPFPSEQNSFLSVSIIVPEESVYAGVGTLINASSIKDVVSPIWINRFQNLVKNWDKQGLVALAKEMNWEVMDLGNLPSGREVIDRFKKGSGNNKTNSSTP